MERCAAAIAALVAHRARGRPVLLLTDTSDVHGTPSNQGSAHFRDWRARGERVLRGLVPGAAAYCGTPGAVVGPECAIVEAALCRRSREVLRFGSGTFSAFLVGDDADAPASTQWLACAGVEEDARKVLGIAR